MKNSVILLAILVSCSASFAEVKLNITCQIHEMGERIDETRVERKEITLANHSSASPSLKLDIYGGRVTVATYLASRKEDSVCEYKNTAICLNSGVTQMCQDNEVMFYPKAGQVGDNTTVTCEVSGDVVTACKF